MAGMTPPSSRTPTAFDRLASSWVYGGFLAGFVLLQLLPVFTAGLSPAFLFVVLQLPIYMLHQYEEHDDDRFRRYVNHAIGRDRDVLPSRAVFVINMAGVWLLNTVSIWLAATVGIGFGLIGIYAVLVNALVHLAPALVTRRYNPGLVTAIVLFLPLGGLGAWLVTATGRAGVPYHLLGLGVALALHLAIVGYVLRNRRRLDRG
jgi:hypothetical protein